MNIIRFSMSWKTGRYEFYLNKRLNFIVGDSATGKTSIGFVLDEYRKDAEGVYVLESTLPVVWLVSEGDYTNFDRLKNSIVFADEEYFRKYRHLLPLVNFLIPNNLYLVVICRYEEPTVSGIDYSLTSIKELKTYNSATYLTERYYLDSPAGIKFDHIFTEDSKAGLDFLRKINPNIKTTNGNGNIKRTLIDYSGNILLFADLACLGRHYASIYDLNDEKRKIYLVPEYECFEELLLRTNYFKDNKDVQDMFRNLPTYANEFLTWEKFFEDFIQKVTTGTPIAISHKRGLRDCYTEPCRDKPHCSSERLENCLYSLPGFDKPYEMLKGTKYEYIYHILKSNCM